MFGRKKAVPINKSDQIVVPTKKGFFYIFDLKLRKIYIVLEDIERRGFRGGEKIGTRLGFLNYQAGLGAFFFAFFAHIFVHEAIHIAVALPLGGKFSGFRITGAPVGVHTDILEITAPEKEFMVAVAPAIFEAFVGLYLIKLGLRKKEPVAFGYGLLVFTTPARHALDSLFAHTDFSVLSSRIKEILIRDFGANEAVKGQISSIPDPAIIFLLASILYGAAIYGSKYVPKISDEIITWKRTKAILQKIEKKDPKLHAALDRIIFSRGARLRKRLFEKINPRLLKR